MPKTLGEALRAHWLISLRCERTRAGLKSVRACPLPVVLDTPTLIASLGHDFGLEELQARLKCPSCGSDRVALRFSLPPGREAGAADAAPKPRRMRPAAGHNTLGSTSEEWIVFKCEATNCGRRGEYKKETLLTQFSPDMQMPELLLQFAAWRGCGRARSFLEMDEKQRAARGQVCGIVYDVDPS